MMELHRHIYRNSLFIEPRCNTFIAAAIASMVVGATTASIVGAGVAGGSLYLSVACPLLVHCRQALHPTPTPQRTAHRWRPRKRSCCR